MALLHYPFVQLADATGLAAGVPVVLLYLLLVWLLLIGTGFWLGRQKEDDR